ncbi:hypothetical protein C8R43DRAFT_475291 [Mycena crocata]|nr:hypothetical protein C8R43DRAFT_475291 [Mycena crocata]
MHLSLTLSSPFSRAPPWHHRTSARLSLNIHTSSRSFHHPNSRAPIFPNPQSANLPNPHPPYRVPTRTRLGLGSHHARDVQAISNSLQLLSQCVFILPSHPPILPSSSQGSSYPRPSSSTHEPADPGQPRAPWTPTSRTTPTLRPEAGAKYISQQNQRVTEKLGWVCPSVRPSESVCCAVGHSSTQVQHIAIKKLCSTHLSSTKLQVCYGSIIF